MEKENILNHMAGYDFKAPIKVTMIYDDSEDDDIIEEQYEINSKKEEQTIVIKQEISDETETKYQTDENIDYETGMDQINSEPENTNQKRKLIANLDEFNYIDKSVENSKTDITKSHKKAPKKPRKSNKSCKKFSKNEQLSKEAEDLQLLSDNIITVMDTYYQMQKNKASIGDYRLKYTVEQFHFVRSHVFDKSLNILKTSILPRENDTAHIESVLDFTIKQAFSKKGIKCTRWTVYPFLFDMIRYAKHRLGYYTSGQHQSSSETPVLKMHLNKSHTPMNISHNNILPNNINPDAFNQQYRFTTGSPGREISLSFKIPPGSNARQGFTHSPLATPDFISPPYVQVLNNGINTYSPVKHTRNVINNLESLEYEQLSQRPVMNMHSNVMYPNENNLILRGPPPPYKKLESSNYYFNYHQQNASQTIANLQTEVDTSRSSVSTESGYVSPSYTSPCFEPVDCGNSEEYTMTPTITNVFSLNPTGLCASGPCAMCGKNTQEKCRLCKKYYYCSSLCEVPS